MLASTLPFALEASNRVFRSSASKSLAGVSLGLLAELKLGALETELLTAERELTVLAGGSSNLLGALDIWLLEPELETTSLAGALTRDPAEARPVWDTIAI